MVFADRVRRPSRGRVQGDGLQFSVTCIGSLSRLTTSDGRGPG
jgi:hypothetical protein